MLLLLARILAAASPPSESRFVLCIAVSSPSIFLVLGRSESFKSICLNMSIVGGGGYSAGREGGDPGEEGGGGGRWAPPPVPTQLCRLISPVTGLSDRVPARTSINALISAATRLNTATATRWRSILWMFTASCEQPGPVLIADGCPCQQCSQPHPKKSFTQRKRKAECGAAECCLNVTGRETV